MLNMKLPYELAIPFLAIYQREKKTYFPTKTLHECL